MYVINLWLRLTDLLLLFYSTGIANSQSSFSCGPVCLLAEWNCYCELSNNKSILILLWRLRGLDMQPVRDDAFFSRGSDDPGTTSTPTFAGGHFLANVTSVTDMTIASVANGTINHTIDGYTLHCVDGGGGGGGDAVISIPGKLRTITNTS